MKYKDNDPDVLYDIVDPEYEER